MNWEIIITSIITAAGMYFFPEIGKAISARFSKTPQERKDDSRALSAKTESEIVKSANEIAAGSTATITNFLRVMEYQKQEMAELRAENAKLETEIEEIKELEAEIEAIKEARRVRDAETQIERDTLEARIKAELIDTRQMRAEHAELKKKVRELNAKQEKDLIETAELKVAVEALRVQNKAAKNVIQKLVQALEEKQIPIPPLNGDLDKLGESVRGLVWPKGKPE